MKTFIVSGLFLIFCGPVFSQVIIKPETARFFLEANDERNLLREKDTLQTVLIKTLQTTTTLKDSIIAHYKSDSVHYKQREETFSLQNTLNTQKITTLQKKLQRRKLVELLAAIGVIILLL